MRRIARLLGKRLGFALPQLLGVVAVTFVMLRLLPGDPAFLIAGPFASPDRIASIRDHLGLNEPLVVQFGTYLRQLMSGNLGESWFSANDVSAEIVRRTPATLELITIAIVISVVVGVGFAILAARHEGTIFARIVRGYASLAGAIPLFWLALVAAFIFSYLLGWLPSPFGRLGQGIAPPPRLTGLYTVDAVLAGEWATFASATKQLVLPVASLVAFYASLILKLASASIEENKRSEYCLYATACGLSERTVVRYALRSSIPTLLTMSGLIYGAMIGGAVLVESVYAWNGLGNYIIDSVVRSDYFAVQGFVLLAAVFNLVVYFLVDVVHYAIDPRSGA